MVLGHGSSGVLGIEVERAGTKLACLSSGSRAFCTCPERAIGARCQASKTADEFMLIYTKVVCVSL